MELGIIFAIYLALSFIIDFVMLCTVGPLESYFPSEIKWKEDLTWVGAIFGFILRLIIFWLHYIVILVLFIFKGKKGVGEFYGRN